MEERELLLALAARHGSAAAVAAVAQALGMPLPPCE
jgi:hypothetical protein